jgi:CrcB protein
MEKVGLIFLFGGLGVVSRYLFNELCSKLFATTLPVATFFVNLIGCFFIGLFLGLTTAKFLPSDHLRIAIVVGFLGGFTTFSSFAFESVRLAEEGAYGVALSYLIISPVLGFGAVVLGQYLAKMS